MHKGLTEVSVEGLSRGANIIEIKMIEKRKPSLAKYHDAVGMSWLYCKIIMQKKLLKKLKIKDLALYSLNNGHSQT